MQLRLVACLLLVLFRELNNFYRPWHSARTQHVHHPIVLKTNTKVELLKHTSIATSCDFSLKLHNAKREKKKHSQNCTIKGWKLATLTWSSDVAPVHVILPDDQIDAVVYGLRNFIVTIPFSRLNSTFAPCKAMSFKANGHRTLKAHTTLLMTISISGSGSSFSSSTGTSAGTSVSVTADSFTSSFTTSLLMASATDCLSLLLV